MIDLFESKQKTNQAGCSIFSFCVERKKKNKPQTCACFYRGLSQLNMGFFSLLHFGFLFWMLCGLELVVD